MILKEKCRIVVNVKITENLLLLGVDKDMKTDTVFDLMILEAKQFICRCKLDKCLPTLSLFLQQLMVRYKIEEYNFQISGELTTFNSNWFCYIPIFAKEN